MEAAQLCAARFSLDPRSLAPVDNPLIEQHGELAPFRARTDPFPAPHGGATFGLTSHNSNTGLTCN